MLNISLIFNVLCVMCAYYIVYAVSAMLNFVCVCLCSGCCGELFHQWAGGRLLNRHCWEVSTSVLILVHLGLQIFSFLSSKSYIKIIYGNILWIVIKYHLVFSKVMDYTLKYFSIWFWLLLLDFSRSYVIFMAPQDHSDSLTWTLNHWHPLQLDPSSLCPVKTDLWEKKSLGIQM